jgi:hypothetical protein
MNSSLNEWFERPYRRHLDEHHSLMRRAAGPSPNAKGKRASVLFHAHPGNSSAPPSGRQLLWAAAAITGVPPRRGRLVLPLEGKDQLLRGQQPDCASQPPPATK